MRVKVLWLVVLVFALGCAKKPVEVPVPGSINAIDAWAFRVVDDSDAAIHAAKIWEQCTVTEFPITVSIDGKTELCDTKKAKYPMAYKDELNLAIDSLNIAKVAGKAYHDSGSGDQTALVAAVGKLSNAVTTLISHIGGSH